MHHQASRSAVEQDAATDREIMDFLLVDRPGLWSEGEIARELGDEIAAQDGIGRLARAGLVHRLDGFVFASRSGASSAALAS